MFSFHRKGSNYMVGNNTLLNILDFSMEYNKALPIYSNPKMMHGKALYHISFIPYHNDVFCILCIFSFMLYCRIRSCFCSSSKLIYVRSHIKKQNLWPLFIINPIAYYVEINPRKLFRLIETSRKNYLII